MTTNEEKIAWLNGYRQGKIDAINEALDKVKELLIKYGIEEMKEVFNESH